MVRGGNRHIGFTIACTEKDSNRLPEGVFIVLLGVRVTLAHTRFGQTYTKLPAVNFFVRTSYTPCMHMCSPFCRRPASRQIMDSSTVPFNVPSYLPMDSGESCAQVGSPGVCMCGCTVVQSKCIKKLPVQMQNNPLISRMMRLSSPRSLACFCPTLTTYYRYPRQNPHCRASSLAVGS